MSGSDVMMPYGAPDEHPLCSFVVVVPSQSESVRALLAQNLHSPDPSKTAIATKKRTPKLQSGDKAPDFKIPDQDGQIRSLKDYKGKKLVLFFYPKDNTSGCTKEACNLRDNHARLKKAGYEVVGISTDSPKSHTGFIEKHDLPFTLL
ncbi:MAG: peroxiredoxin, partial [Flavobacteriales bacterium]